MEGKYWSAEEGPHARNYETKVQRGVRITEKLKAKRALKGSGRGSKGDKIIYDDGAFVKSQISDTIRARSPLIEVINLQRNKDAKLLLARPSDLAYRLLDELQPRERQQLRLVDRLAFGAKRPSHQNELTTQRR